MKQKPKGRPLSSEKIIRDIKRKTRRRYSAEEKIRIVLDGVRGEDSIAQLCRANVVEKPRLLSDNGSSYISNDLADWLSDNGMSHVHGAPYATLLTEFRITCRRSLKAME